MRENSTIARIENALIFDSKYQLTAKEQKIILLLISKIDPTTQFGLGVQLVSLKDLEKIINGNIISGSFRKELNQFASRILQKQLAFKTNYVFRGERLDGHMNWFQSIIPTLTESGEMAMEFQFSNRLKPFLLDLKEYAQIDYQEVLPLQSGHSVRMYQIFKAHRNKMRKHQHKSNIIYAVEEFKALLGIDNKYQDFRNLRKRVLKPIEDEINLSTSICVKYSPIRENRKIVAIRFEFWESANKEVLPKSKKKTFDSLSFAELKAYKQLINYGIKESICFEMLNRVGGSEIVGFEDWYFESVINIFESKTSANDSSQKAGILVNWFLKKKVFEQGDMIAKIIEGLQTKKKKLQNSNTESWDNRLLAKSMNAEEFRLLKVKKRIP